MLRSIQLACLDKLLMNYIRFDEIDLTRDAKITRVGMFKQTFNECHFRIDGIILTGDAKINTVGMFRQTFHVILGWVRLF